MSEDERTIAMQRPSGPESQLVGKILEHYHLTRLIGKGGMGYVYLANDTVLQRQVAVKVLPAELTADEMLMKRFLTEARACAKLNHPNVAAIYAIGEHDGLHYIVMELLEGGDLNRRIRRSEGSTFQEATEVIRQAAAGLATAHAQGIVHRDIKPSNIMFTGDGSVKITDFGLARVATASREITARGAILGTPQYMSPEQCQGREVHAASDVYSLGITYYTLLTGQVPFRGDSSMAIMFQHLHEPPPDLTQLCPNIPSNLYAIISKCLEKRPADRYRDCGELVEALDQFLAGAGSLREQRLQIGDPEQLSRWLDARSFEAKVTQHQSAIRSTTKTGRLGTLPSPPECELLACETSLEGIDRLSSRPLEADELEEAKRILDDFAARHPGLPGDLSGRVQFGQCRLESLVSGELRTVLGILEFKIECIPWDRHASLPAGTRGYEPGEEAHVLVDELIGEKGDFFTGISWSGDHSYEEFRAFAALPEKACPQCHGQGRAACRCRNGTIIREVQEQYEEVEACSECGGSGQRRADQRGQSGRCVACEGTGQSRRPAWRHREEVHTCPDCQGSGTLSCSVCAGMTKVRPIIYKRRRSQAETVRETRYDGTVESRYLDRCVRPPDFLRVRLGYPRPEELLEKLREQTEPVAERLEANAAQMDVASLVTSAEQRRQLVGDGGGSQLEQVPEEYRGIFTDSPACTGGHVEGMRTVRYVRAELSFGAAYVRRLEFNHGGHAFTAWILPDGSVVGDRMIEEWQTERALTALRSSVEAILSRAVRVPRSQGDWAVILLFWGGLSGYLVLMLILLNWLVHKLL